MCAMILYHQKMHIGYFNQQDSVTLHVIDDNDVQEKKGGLNFMHLFLSIWTY
jgi:hypothetical protein